MSISDLIGKPWSVPCEPPKSFDCWELCVEVRNRFGIKTAPYPVAAGRRTPADRLALSQPDPKVWVQLESPRDFCLVGFGHRIVNHCGVYLRRRVIHAHGGLGAVVCQDITVAQLTMGKATFWEMVDG